MRAIRWWAVAAAGAAPVLIIGGYFVATAVQPDSYDPVRDSISDLAKQGATDPWLMTSALAGVGFCYLFVALGLHPARPTGRIVLAFGGVATVLIATFRQPNHGYSLPHELAVVAAALTCCTWPLFASQRRHPALLMARAPSVAATGVLLGLVAWYALESHGTLLGVAERCAAAAPPLWLFAVVLTTQRRASLQVRLNVGGKFSPAVASAKSDALFPR
ncbi:MAG: DUF998 domain-containing protein [Acidimicrobiales bacterium]